MTPTKLAGNIGKGLMAGFAGTVFMTVSSTIEQQARRRQASSAPADAAEKLLGIEKFHAAEQRFSTLVHWGYGTGWGVMRGLLRGAGLSPELATAAHYSAVWGGAQVMLPALEVAMWGLKEVAIHHLVYAVTAGIAYELLDGKR